MEIQNKARGYAFIFSALRGQQADPFCSSCNSFAKVLTAAREGIDEFAAGLTGDPGSLPADLSRLLADAKDGLTSMHMPERTEGQKKAGNCKLPEGVCFLKSSLALTQKI